MIGLKNHHNSDIRFLKTYLPTLRIKPQIPQNIPTYLMADIISGEPLRGRLQRTSGKWGGGGGFEISDIPGRGEGGWFVKVRTSENI